MLSRHSETDMHRATRGYREREPGALPPRCLQCCKQLKQKQTLCSMHPKAGRRITPTHPPTHPPTQPPTYMEADGIGGRREASRLSHRLCVALWLSHRLSHRPSHRLSDRLSHKAFCGSLPRNAKGLCHPRIRLPPPAYPHLYE